MTVWSDNSKAKVCLRAESLGGWVTESFTAWTISEVRALWDHSDGF